ncbi:MAG: NADH-quinone oxidoreductase subunit NuoH [Dehalococcoidia bacterium]
MIPVIYPLAVSLLDVGAIVLGLLLLFVALSIVVLSMVWLERKALGRLQLRLGPTRTGPMGLLQPIADALKLVLKEDITPNNSDKAIFWVAPVIVVISAFMIWVTIPGTKHLVVRNLELGLFYITAFAVVGILGLVLAGWGSANKYGVLGGLRSAAQLISYEIPIILVVVAAAMLAQSLDLQEIVLAQDPIINVLILPLGMVILFVAGLAEVGRTPFDIYHAESEVVGGPFVEYSGAHWAVFFLAEYINTFAIAALVTILFLGGWLGPSVSLPLPSWLPFWLDWLRWFDPMPPGIVWFLIKVYAVVLVVFWVRGTFPRLRIDQLMAFAWKVMLPLAFYAILIAGVYLFYDWPAWSLTLMSLVGLGVVGYLVYRRMVAPARRVAEIRARQEQLQAQRRAAREASQELQGV